MNKQEFLEKLREVLSEEMDPTKVTDNVSYYGQYIEDELRKGRSEQDIMDELGDPWVIARGIIDSPENVEEVTGSYEEKRRSYSYDPGSQDGENNVKVWRFDKGWQQIIMLVILILVVVGMIYVIGGILSIILPIVIPVALVFLVYRIVRRLLS